MSNFYPEAPNFLTFKKFCRYGPDEEGFGKETRQVACFLIHIKVQVSNLAISVPPAGKDCG